MSVLIPFCEAQSVSLAHSPRKSKPSPLEHGMLRRQLAQQEAASDGDSAVERISKPMKTWLQGEETVHTAERGERTNRIYLCERAIQELPAPPLPPPPRSHSPERPISLHMLHPVCPICHPIHVLNSTTSLNGKSSSTRSKRCDGRSACARRRLQRVRR